jgi:YhcH/YjgK/YiaL family protein
MKSIFPLTIILFLLTAGLHASAQTDTKEWTAHQTKIWFGEKEWLGGLQLEPHKTVNKAEFAQQYHLNKAYWDKAFTFLKEHDLQRLAVGRYPIDGENVFALVTENPTRDYDSTKWESHRNYIDLHYVASGEEKIGVYPITRLTVTKSYDASADLTNYSGTGKTYTARPGTFFLFFPSDGHRPGITPGGKKTDKKIVIKIRYK